MKKKISIVLTLGVTFALMSFTKNNAELDLMNYESTYCYWEETFSPQIEARRGDACGKERSLRVYFTNPYSYTIKVAFYLRDLNGELSPYSPYVVTLAPGKRKYHHICESNGRYVVLAKRADSYDCYFPSLN